MEDKEKYKNRVSGISGRTAGKMHRATKTKTSSEKRPLRARNQLSPSSKERFPTGKFHAMDAVIPISEIAIRYHKRGMGGMMA